MAETQWRLAYKDLAADEMVELVSPLPRRLLERLAKSFQGVDLTADPPPSIMLTVLFEPVPDVDEVARVAAERRERDKLADAAGRAIRKMLKEQANA